MTQKQDAQPLNDVTRRVLEKMLENCQEPITKIDLKGHGGYEPGELLDLTVEPTGFNEKWSWKYWKDMTKTQGLNKSHIESALQINQQKFGDMTLELLTMGGTAKCSTCGERLAFAQKGDTLVALETCEHPGGLKPYAVLIDVPSGEIVFANDLRALVDVEDNYDVNSSIGVKRTTESYATDGMAHILVGNTCPTVFKTGHGLSVSLNNDWDDENGDLDIGEEQGSICTDLWWYSAMDKDLFEARCAELNVDPKDYMDFSVKVDPGVYSFSDEQADRDADGVVHLSHIVRSTEKAPKLKKRDFGPSDTLEDSQFWKEIEALKKSPLFKGNRNYTLADILTVLGNGYEWSQGGLRNRDGQITDTPFRPKQEAVENPRDTSFIPELPDFEFGFRAKDLAYPMSFGYNTLLNAPENADPYWIAGTMMYLKSALQQDFKMIGNEKNTDEQNEKTVTINRQVMTTALDLMCEIAERQKLNSDGRLEHIFTEISNAWKS